MKKNNKILLSIKNASYQYNDAEEGEYAEDGEYSEEGEYTEDGEYSEEGEYTEDGEYAEEIKEHFSKYNRYLFCENKVDSIMTALNNISSSPSLHMPCSAFDPKTISEEFIK